MRNIAVFTCNRADESPMSPVCDAIEAHPRLRLFNLDDKPRTAGHGDVDWVVVLGDRHELLPACHTAILNRIPIAHIHGGETTLGSFDDKIRNAVSQLADIHFTAAPQFTDKLVSMGIDPKTIHTVGAPSLDDLETDPVCEFGDGFFLVTLHPETAGGGDNAAMANELCLALDRFPDRSVVLTDSNLDPGGDVVSARLARYANTNRGRVIHFHTLGRRRYLTAMKHAAVVIGNSSSGIIEAPALGTPTVNIGRRQEGRPMADTVIGAEPSADDITDSIAAAMHPNVRSWGKTKPLPYGAGGASKKIAEVLATWRL